MKGIIFTEFLELVEDKFGLDITDQMLEMCQDQGIYTAVGSYDHIDLVKLIVALSKLTGISAEDLQQVYGRTVFNTLLESLPPHASLNRCETTFQFIQHVEHYIHVEVKKLYPDAQPPQFKFLSVNETEMLMDYTSARCLSHVCFGLIQGCADHYQQQVEIAMTPQDQNGSHVQFKLSLVQQ
ncbi:heme NO-binding domain-containing protein [Vibrio sp. SCSIO 43136]|uniref:heme NO-binding domain-containing protein n=1 Tax=Vibrio sp. SCSIO 43136 TaxID=2819101 RepID=UPI0020766635|nr:heme NO-binding domain-containing protein [Vibrio sp. SCSIO 43136]USD66895.1 heme NO-binding domain-containing protein [Vibrio sp. SCSIO 43136]